MLKIIISSLVAISFFFPYLCQAGVESAIVKVFATQLEKSYSLPWSTHISQEVVGSGCVIPGKRVLTNAHIVSNQTYVQVRKNGHPQKYEARVHSVSHAADLAILTVDDPAFFKGIRPLEIGPLPSVREEVAVFGFPEGGDALSVTAGIVSRIEHQDYAHSGHSLLSVQLDAAVNTGNSGGPAISAGKIVGVVMQSMDDSQNVNYMVPPPVITHYLKDIADGKHDGIPRIGIVEQSTEMSDWSEFLALPEENWGSGIMVLQAIPGMPADGKLIPFDVVVSIDGHDIAYDGTVELRDGRWTNWRHYVQLHQIGEEVSLDVIRDGHKLKIFIPLFATVDEGHLVRRLEYDSPPRFYIYAGLVFAPLTQNFLSIYDDEKGMLPYFFDLAENHLQKTPNEEVVIVQDILSSSLNSGCGLLLERLVEINGKKVSNLKAAVRILTESDGRKFDLFKASTGEVCIVSRMKAIRDHAELLERYGIPKDRSNKL